MSSSKQYNLQPYEVIDSPSVTTSVISLTTEIFNKDNITYQISWTGTLVGAFTVETSNDRVVWDTVPLGSAAAAGGTPDSGTIELNQLGSKFVHLVFTRASGTGALLALVTGKAI